MLFQHQLYRQSLVRLLLGGCILSLSNSYAFLLHSLKLPRDFQHLSFLCLSKGWLHIESTLCFVSISQTSLQSNKFVPAVRRNSSIYSNIRVDTFCDLDISKRVYWLVSNMAGKRSSSMSTMGFSRYHLSLLLMTHQMIIKNKLWANDRKTIHGGASKSSQKNPSRDRLLQDTGCF